MKQKILIFIVCILLYSTAFAQFEVKLNDELYISKIHENTYIITHYFPWESNSMIVQASEKEVVLIDTPYDTTATSIMLKWIDTNLKPERITAINTGFHIDNLGGNGSLLNHGIDVYGSDVSCKLVDERGKTTQNQIISWLSPNQEKYRKVYQTLEFYKPNKIFKITDGLNLNIGNFSFEVFFPGESHSPDNVTVYIKELNLLFVGCIVKSLSSKNLGFTGDANMQEWPESILKIKEKYPDATIIIPHHGMWGDMSLLDHTYELFEK